MKLFKKRVYMRIASPKLRRPKVTRYAKDLRHYEELLKQYSDGRKGVNVVYAPEMFRV